MSERRSLPKTIWVIGFVSMLMDISSESIHSVLPLFMVNSLGISVLAVGIIDGFAEATTNIVKVFSGTLSDYLNKRKALTVLGYGLSALSKPVFPLASSVSHIIFGRVADRVGKGIRGAPRDALMADVAPPDLRGAAFGLRQSLDTTGAFIGPILAVVLMAWTHGNFRTVFWVATIPALLAVALLVLGVREPESSSTGRASRPRLRWSDLKTFKRNYWLVVALGGIFTLARFSEAFLVLRAQSLGLAATAVPAVMIVMNIAYGLSAYPAGALSDRVSNSGMLSVGLAVLVVADLAIASASGIPMLAAGVLLWGLHMGLTQGLLSAMVAGCAPAELRGTAFGIFNLVSGLALLPAGAVAGLLWTRFGPPATFMCGAVFAVLALLIVTGTMRPSANPDR